MVIDYRLSSIREKFVTQTILDWSSFLFPSFKIRHSFRLDPTVSFFACPLAFLVVSPTLSILITRSLTTLPFRFLYFLSSPFSHNFSLFFARSTESLQMKDVDYWIILSQRPRIEVQSIISCSVPPAMAKEWIIVGSIKEESVAPNNKLCLKYNCFIFASYDQCPLLRRRACSPQDLSSFLIFSPSLNCMWRNARQVLPPYAKCTHHIYTK